MDFLERFKKIFVVDRNDPKRRRGPWRKAPSFTNENLEILKKHIESFRPPSALNISRARILLIGMTASGKSSIYNTINSAFSGRITQKAICGTAVGSLTTTYLPYLVRGSTGTTMNFCLCDTCGIEESRGPDLKELNYLLDGHVPVGYEFDPESPITPQVSGFIRHPKLEDKVHCVVFVIDASAIDIISNWYWQKLRTLQVQMNKKGIPRVVLLTKIDKISPNVADDVSKIFESSEFGEMVRKVAEKIGVTENSVLPIRNYREETNLDEKINILALTALDKILGSANDFFFLQLDLMEGRGGQVNDQSLSFVIVACIVFIAIVGYFAWGKSLF